MAELWEMMMGMWAVWAKGRCGVVWWIDGASKKRVWLLAIVLVWTFPLFV